MSNPIEVRERDPTGITIRPARTTDAEAVVRLRVRAGNVPTVTDRVDVVRRLVAMGGERLLVAEEAGRVVGTLIATFDGWRGNLYRLAVAPEARRRGTGLALVREAERKLVAQGAIRIHAGVRGDHAHATSFWASAGYRHHPETRRYTKQLNS